MRKTRTSEFHPAKLISIVSFPITRSNVKYPQRPLALELARSFVDRGSVPDRCKTTVRPDWLLHDGWHYSNSPWRSVPISTRSLCSVASMVFPPITRPSRGNHFEAPWRFSAPRARRIRFLRGVSRGHAQGWMSKEKTIFRDGYVIGRTQRGTERETEKRRGVAEGGGEGTPGQGETHMGYKARREYSWKWILVSNSKYEPVSLVVQSVHNSPGEGGN